MAGPSPRVPLNRRHITRTGALVAALASAALVAAPAPVLASAVADGGAAGGGAGPTVVLAHAAFADTSGWSPVVERPESAGYKVVAPANPLRGLVGDSTYPASVPKSIDGPIVPAGHSYGARLISGAADGTASGPGGRPALADPGPRDTVFTSAGGLASLALVAGAVLVAAVRRYRR